MKVIDRRLIVFVFALAVATPAAAAPGEDSFFVNGVYLFNSATEIGNSDVSSDGANGLAGYLGYRVLPWLSLELGGIDFKPIDSTLVTSQIGERTEHEVGGYTAGVRAETSFADLFDIWLAVGVFSWESTFNYEISYRSFPGLSRTGSDSNSGEDIYYRVGVTMPMTESFSVTVESAHFELNDFFSSADPDTGGNFDYEHRYIGLGLEYSF